MDARRALAAACALSLLAASPALGARAVAPETSRPDLVVSTGAVRVDGGAISGSFVVRRSPGRIVGGSSAVLMIRVAGRRRVVARFMVPALRRVAARTVKVVGEVPAGIPAGSYALRACADSGGRVRERSESNNCRTVGRLTVAAPGMNVEAPAPAPPLTPPAVPSSVPSDPVPFAKDSVFTLSDALTNYWIDVPSAYDASHATPITLFVWLHGCGGQSQYDISMVSPGGSQDYIAIAVGGQEGNCWDVNADSAKVLAAIADVRTHFNIDPHRIVLGGYSSGGDLTYRMAFYDASTFAGVLVENSSPFRDTGSSQSASIAAAAWKFNVVHLAHLQDAVYPIAGVQAETDALTAAGFPMTRIERTGTHYDADAGPTGTAYDLRAFLLPHLDDGWVSP